jgi:fatty acid desaturase
MTTENHPHELESAPVPARLSAARLRELSRIEDSRAAAAIASEWLAICAAIAICSWRSHWALDIVGVVFVGARQHALLVLAHDASHFRLFSRRWANEWLGNLLLAWPLFVTVEGFRHFHGRHHRFLATEQDGNRVLWSTHTPEGALSREWTYPKSPLQLAWTVLRRSLLWTGVLWVLRGLVGGFWYAESRVNSLARGVFLLALAAAFTLFGAWKFVLLYWFLPYCTWHVAIQYVRLICEHSNTHAPAPYHLTRTTLPTLLESMFVLPRNIGYHLAHHWYPSVPFYRLPELHAALLENPDYAARAPIFSSVRASLRDVIAPVDRQGSFPRS